MKDDTINGRIFQEIVVEYYPLYSTDPKYKRKPYFSIKYTENGQEFIGYGTCSPEVLSEYLKEYFMQSAQPEQRWILCVDGNEPKANADCWISTNAKYVRRASYAPKANNQPNGFIVTEGGFGFYEYGKSAKAWMPYEEPEPYRESEHWVNIAESLLDGKDGADSI